MRGYGFMVVVEMEKLKGYEIEEYGVEEWGSRKKMIGLMLVREEEWEILKVEKS